MEEFDWIAEATKRYHEYRAEANKYGDESENITDVARIIALINGAKAVVLAELLEMAGVKLK